MDRLPAIFDQVARKVAIQGRLTYSYIRQALIDSQPERYGLEGDIPEAAPGQPYGRKVLYAHQFNENLTLEALGVNWNKKDVRTAIHNHAEPDHTAKAIIYPLNQSVEQIVGQKKGRSVLHQELYRRTDSGVILLKTTSAEAGAYVSVPDTLYHRAWAEKGTPVISVHFYFREGQGSATDGSRILQLEEGEWFEYEIKEGGAWYVDEDRLSGRVAPVGYLDQRLRLEPILG